MKNEKQSKTQWHTTAERVKNLFKNKKREGDQQEATTPITGATDERGDQKHEHGIEEKILKSYAIKLFKCRY